MRVGVHRLCLSCIRGCTDLNSRPPRPHLAALPQSAVAGADAEGFPIQAGELVPALLDVGLDGGDGVVGEMGEAPLRSEEVANRDVSLWAVGDAPTAVAAFGEREVARLDGEPDDFGRLRRRIAPAGRTGA